MFSYGPARDTLELRQEPIGPGRTRLVLAGRLDRAVAGLLLGWTEDICDGGLADVELDLAGLTSVDRPGVLALADACAALQRHSRRVEIVPAGDPGSRRSDRDGGRR